MFYLNMELVFNLEDIYFYVFVFYICYLGFIFVLLIFGFIIYMVFYVSVVYLKKNVEMYVNIR